MSRRLLAPAPDVFGQGFSNDYQIGARASAQEEYYKKKLDKLMRQELQEQENERRKNEEAQLKEKEELKKLADYYKQQTEELQKAIKEKHEGVKESSVLEGQVDIRKEENKNYADIYLKHARNELHKSEGEGN